MRHAQNFPGYQPFPTSAATIGSSVPPPMGGNIHQFGRHGDSSAIMSKKRSEREEDDSALFGDLPEGKRRKFILVDDTQKNSRVRVKVTLDQVNVQDIPDSYRKQNSVYPRSYYPIQMQSEPEAGRFNLESTDYDNGAPTIGRMTVPCTTSDGESLVEVAQLTKAKRSRERNTNELGYRMAWGQGRVFSKRPIFLARSVDAYRLKQRSALTSSGVEETAIPAHLEVRPGKRRWQERVHPAAEIDLDIKDTEDV